MEGDVSRCSSDVKKIRERFLLEMFLEKAKLGAQIVESREAPDFLVRIDQSLIGVEITELFINQDSHGATLQAQEAISSRIAAKAQRLYLETGAPPVHVTMCFSPGRDLRGLNRDVVAQALCDYVGGLRLSLWQHKDWRPEGLNDVLPDEISFVHALGVPSADMMHWGVARAGWVAPLAQDPLQKRIDEKAKRLATYRNVASENWLLVVADAMKPSSSIEAKTGFNPKKIESPFDRTFFYRHPDSVLELGVLR